MTLSSFVRPLALSSCMMFATATASLSQSPADPSLAGNIGRLTQEAAFVFRGQAVKVQYRNLASAAGTIPYTFVTYRVDKTISGTPKRFVTLRFVGGPDGMGGFVAAIGVPMFQLGDQDILFVSNNGMTPGPSGSCALVGCELGRYRIVDGAVYNAGGAAVTGIRKGKIVTGGLGPEKVLELTVPAPKFDDMLKKPEFVASFRLMGMSVSEARSRYEAEAPKTVTIRQEMSAIPADGVTGDDTTTRSAGGREVGILADSVVDGIKQQIAASGLARTTAAPNTFTDAHVTDTVSLSPMAASAPIEAQSDKLLPTPGK